MTIKNIEPTANTYHMRAGLLRQRFLQSFITNPGLRKEIADLFMPLSSLERANLIVEAMNEFEAEKPLTHPCLQGVGVCLSADLKAQFENLRDKVYYRCPLTHLPPVDSVMKKDEILEFQFLGRTDVFIARFSTFLEFILTMHDPLTMDKLLESRRAAKMLFWGDSP